MAPAWMHFWLKQAQPTDEPEIGSADYNDEPPADAMVDGRKWWNLSMEQQDAYLSQREGVDKICAGLRG